MSFLSFYLLKRSLNLYLFPTTLSYCLLALREQAKNLLEETLKDGHSYNPYRKGRIGLWPHA